MVEVRREGDTVSIVDGETVIDIDVEDVLSLVEALIAVCGEQDQVVTELVAAGVDPYVARRLSTSVTLAQVRGWLRYIADQGDGLQRPTAFLVARLQQGEWPPHEDRRRYIDGEYGKYIKR